MLLSEFEMCCFKLLFLLIFSLNLALIQAEETNNIEVYGDIKARLSIVFPDGYKMNYYLDSGSYVNDYLPTHDKNGRLIKSWYIDVDEKIKLDINKPIVCDLVVYPSFDYKVVNTAVKKTNSRVKNIELFADVPSNYIVSLPKIIDISKPLTNYDIFVYGDIGSLETLYVKPLFEEFELKCKYHKKTKATVIHEKTNFSIVDFIDDGQSQAKGRITHDPLKPGYWTGNFEVLISLERQYA